MGEVTVDVERQQDEAVAASEEGLPGWEKQMPEILKVEARR